MSFVGGWKKASLYDPATGDVAQINKIATEHSEWVDEPMRTEHTKGALYGGTENRATVGFFESDTALLNKIEDWQDGNTPLCLVIVGEQGNVIWHKPRSVHFVRNIGTDARTGLETHLISLESFGVPDKIWSGVNLLNGFAHVHGFDYGWSDENPNADGIASGWESGVTGTFANNEQTIDGDMYIEAVFPVSGVDLRGKVAVLSSAGTYNNYILQNDYDDVELSSDSESAGTLVSGVTQSGIWKIRFGIEQTASGDITFKNPFMRVDKKDRYVRY